MTRPAARALAAGGVWKRLVVDPVSGALLDHGRTTYSPPDALADFVRARDCTCRGPLCSKPIRDLDHHIPWAGGVGRTSAENLHGFCMGDHKLKDAPGWKVLAHPDGSLTWISPCGRRRTTRPHDYRPFTDPMPEQADGTPAPDAVGALDPSTPDAVTSEAAGGTATADTGTGTSGVPDSTGTGASIADGASGDEARSADHGDQGAAPDDDPPPF